MPNLWVEVVIHDLCPAQLQPLAPPALVDEHCRVTAGEGVQVFQVGAGDGQLDL